ncbi:MAG TPA: glutamate--tRNA ligase [Acidimicrobiales bacterium]|nr:glutamate--tRNA ligase [Acidimicrobiales bacterium]
MTVRTRISPSPTGYFHVGGGRTALYNWFLARQSGGAFILRIEDTDQERHNEEAVDGIRRAMRWLGLDWDEEYRQSERAPVYAAAVDRLVGAGVVYNCECTRDDVAARKPPGAPPGYDRFCRDRGLDPAPGRALRFKVPLPGSTTVQDLIHGDVVVDHDNIEDFVVARADGSALFLLANTVDDLDAHVTHVVRGDDHLPNTPKYQLLWDALGGADLPVFAHLPMIVNEKRQKLSKRRDTDKVVMEDYIAEGYLPAAMRNYLALLGWAPGENREIVTLEEMVAQFALADVNSSPAFFDVKKLRSFNGDYIRALSVEEFVAASEPFLAAGPWPPDRFSAETFRAIAPEVQTRVEVLSQVPAMVDFLFLANPPVDDAAWAKVMNADSAAPMLDGVAERYAACTWDADTLHAETLAAGEKIGLKLGKAQAPVRVAVTGRTVGPPLFESLVVLGRDRTLERIDAARARLS